MYVILWFFLLIPAFYLFRFIALTKGWLTRNYMGDLIPSGYGILLLFFILLYVSLYNQQVTSIEGSLLFFIGLLIFVGWIDDRYGNPAIKGMKGHLSYLFNTGKLSMGCVKAIMGAGAGMALAFQLTNNPIEFLLYSGVLTLSTNFINLLDVRPGRALKGFGLFFSFIYLLGTFPSYLSMYSILLVAFFFAALIFDLQGAMMLGDAGANGLGFSLGSFFILSLPIQWIWVHFFFLLGIHWYAEKSSISTFIKKHALLRRVDEWGRNVDP